MDPVNSFDSLQLLEIAFICIVIQGVCTNVVNVVIFSEKTMQKNVTFRLLLSLSKVDLVLLSFCTLDSILNHIFLVELRLFSNLTCKIHMFLTYFFSHLSSILMMVVSIERTLLIYNKRLACLRLVCINRFITILALAIAFINSHYLYYFRLNLELKIDPFDDYFAVANKTINDPNDIYVPR
jgi:hypothetical protein